ncbi:MAG: DUF2156 domain-containing protein, partial [Spirochaetales bacterium]|nr:DUF2156 domain-containing protein [Spirochaetales bacterium]
MRKRRGQPDYETVWIRVIAVFLFVTGVMNLISSLFSFSIVRFELLEDALTYQLIMGSRIMVLFSGILALITAPALYRRKRSAWIIAILLLALSGIGHLGKGADVEESALCLILFGALLPLYRHCSVKSDPLRLRHGGLILVATVLFLTAYTIAGTHFLADELGLTRGNYSVWTVSLKALLFDTSSFDPQTKRALLFNDTLLLSNFLSLITVLFLALSPVIMRSIQDPHNQPDNDFTRDFASRPVSLIASSPSYLHFYRDRGKGTGLVNYALSRRVALAVGNPVCRDLEAQAIGREWLGFCREYDWIPAAFQVDGPFLDYLISEGYARVPCGVEALVDTAGFSLAGKQKQNLRTAVNRGTREEWLIRDFGESDWDDVKGLNDRWIGQHGGKEKSFGMGSATSSYLAETRTRLLYSREGVLLAYLNTFDLKRASIRSIDLMRRNPDSPGAIEYLFVKEIETARDEGFARFDLGYSPLAMV